jgi:hypothetical protein
MNGFIYFQKTTKDQPITAEDIVEYFVSKGLDEDSATMKASQKLNFSEISALKGWQWNRLPKEQRDNFNSLAKQLKKTASHYLEKLSAMVLEAYEDGIIIGGFLLEEDNNLKKFGPSVTGN